MCPVLIAGATWFRMRSSGGILRTRWRNFALHKWCNDCVTPNWRIMVRINVRVTVVYWNPFEWQILKVQSQCEGHRGRGLESEQEKWRPCGKKEPARMGTGYIDGGRKNRQKENSATEDAIGKHVQQSSRRTIVTNSQKSARIQHTHIKHVKAISLGIAHLVTQHSSFIWYHQEAVDLTGFIHSLSLLYTFYY
jgi:hypothetical protein